MDYLTIARWSIPISWLAFIAAALYIDYRIKKVFPATGLHIDRLLGLYIIVWKGSYVIFHFEEVKQAPLSLLYFDGGIAGHIAALVVLLVYVTWKKIHSDQLLLILVRFIAVYSITYYLLNADWIIALISMTILFFIEKKYSYWLFALQWLLIVYVEGWQSYFVYTLGLLILNDLFQSKKLQLVATVFIASLISTMISTYPLNTTTLERSSIHLETMTGEMYQLDEQVESIIVVNFFATWCPPCNAEMPHLKKFSENLPAHVQLIGINLSARDNGAEVLKSFVYKHQVDYPILLDINDEYGKSYDIRSIPTTVIMKDGDEVRRIVGPVSDEQLRKLVKEL